MDKPQVSIPHLEQWKNDDEQFMQSITHLKKKLEEFSTWEFTMDNLETITIKGLITRPVTLHYDREFLLMMQRILVLINEELKAVSRKVGFSLEKLLYNTQEKSRVIEQWQLYAESLESSPENDKRLLQRIEYLEEKLFSLVPKEPKSQYEYSAHTMPMKLHLDYVKVPEPTIESVLEADDKSSGKRRGK